jgi:O-antigen/teichoic acid export membrane protein
MKKDKPSLLRGSLTLLILLNVFNVINLAFQFLMARALTVEEYGILATLFALAFVLSLFSESIQTVVTKYVSRSNNLGKIHGFLNSSTKKYFILALILFAIYVIISIPFSAAMGISFWLFVLNGLTLIIVFLSPITWGALQGRKQFHALGWNIVLSAIVKLVLALLFIAIGWKVGGAVAATILGGLGGWMISFIPLRDVYRAKVRRVENQILDSHSRSIFTLFALLFTFYSLDVIIAKIVFDPTTAGYYSLASVLAKTIFLGTQPISKAMFPFSAQAKAKSHAEKIFFKAAGMLIACSLCALIVFYFFPTLLFYLFAGKYVQSAASILFYVGIAVTLMSLTNLVFYYNISTGKTNGLIIYAICILLEVILLSVFSSSLISFSLALITASTIFLLASIFVQHKWKRSQ